MAFGEKSNNKPVDYSIIFIALVVFVIVLKTLQSFIRPFVIALILTFLLMPILRWSKKKNISFGIIFSAIILVFVLFMILFAFLFSGYASSISQSIPHYGQQISQSGQNIYELTSKINIADKTLNLDEFINVEKISQIVAVLMQSIAKSIGFVFGELFLVLLFLMFILPSHEKIIQYLENDLESSNIKKFRSVLLKIEKSIRDYLVAKIHISFGTALLSAIILFAFNANFVIILAVLIFALNFIPNIGSLIAVAIALLSYAITFGLTLNLIWLCLLLVLVQLIFGNIIEPKITANKLSISPVIILFGLLFWGWVWGIIGMLLATPLTCIIKIVLENIDSTKKLAKYLG